MKKSRRHQQKKARAISKEKASSSSCSTNGGRGIHVQLWTMSGVWGFETESWGHGFTISRSDPVEALERLLDEEDACLLDKEDDASTVYSDTSFEVDPRLEEELERLLNEASSDEGDSESKEEDFEDDVVEQRLSSLRSRRDDGMKQRLAPWEKEETVSVLNRELAGVTTELRDMERWFRQFHREDET